MYLLPMQNVLNLDHLHPHRKMLRDDRLVLFAKEFIGEAVFVSHEWLGFDHADPNGEQLSVLQRILTRLMDGQVQKVETHWAQKLFLKHSNVVRADRWKSALPNMLCWIDYACIPQASGRGGGGDSADSDTSSGLAKAVKSIPAYVANSVFLLVLAPVVTHDDKHEICNYSTWRSRGWCRTEL